MKATNRPRWSIFLLAALASSVMATVQAQIVPFDTRPGGQTDFWRSWGKPGKITYAFLQGGWGSGKTWIGARKLVRLHFHNAFANNGRATFVPSAVIAPTYSNAMDYDVPELQAALDDFNLSWTWKSSGTLANGKFSAPALILDDLGTRRRPSVILIRTADAPDRITGWEVGAAWGDEPARWKRDDVDPKMDPYLQLTGRVRHPLARLRMLMFTGTNEGDATRFYEEAHGGKPNHEAFTALTADNPSVSEFFESQKALLSPEMAEQYLRGGAMSLRGSNAYPYYEPAIHLNESVKFDRHLPLDITFDFNINPGMHAELGQYNQAVDEFRVVREFHGPRLDVLGLMEQVEAFIMGAGGWKKLGFPELRVFGDSSGRASAITTGESCYQIIRQKLDAMKVPYVVRVKKENPRVVDRTNAVNAALQDINRKSHVHIHTSCERLANDLRRQKYDARGKLDDSDKAMGHAGDALGYWIEYLRPVRVAIDDEPGQFNV